MGILKNKTCFISGATGGLGSELARQLAKNNCNLFLTSTNEEKLAKLSQDLKSNFNIDVIADSFEKIINNIH